MQSPPGIYIIAELVQRQIIDFKETTLLQIGRRDTPATAQVVVEPVSDDVAKSAFRLKLCLELQVRILGVVRKRQAERVKNLLREHLVARPSGFAPAQALRRAERSSPISTKSLKWPA